jgi:metal-responsive CopG/Arc/MetJ family transcriptional regulator
MRRINVSLPDDVVDDLDGVARVIGSTRSGLISGILQDMKLSEVRRILSYAEQAQDGDSKAAKRYRGESAEYIVEQLQKALHPQGGLFDDPER